MTTTRKLALALAAALITAGNGVYASHLRAQTEVDNPDCGGQTFCGTKGCPTGCFCSIGFGKAQCYKD